MKLNKANPNIHLKSKSERWGYEEMHNPQEQQFPQTRLPLKMRMQEL